MMNDLEKMAREWYEENFGKGTIGSFSENDWDGEPGISRRDAVDLCSQFARYVEAQRWIPTSEKLPGEQGNDSEDVMCFLNGNCELVDFDKRGGGGWGIRLGFYDAEKGAFRCGGIVDRYVTHWRPLPPPPEVTK